MCAHIIVESNLNRNMTSRGQSANIGAGHGSRTPTSTVCDDLCPSVARQSMSDVLISFYGDDFTGSTDAMESLARSGVRTVLFTDPPTPAQLAHYPDMSAFGVAGITRSLPPDEMERQLRPALQALRDSVRRLCTTRSARRSIPRQPSAASAGSSTWGWMSSGAGSFRCSSARRHWADTASSATSSPAVALNLSHIAWTDIHR